MKYNVPFLKYYARCSQVILYISAVNKGVGIFRVQIKALSVNCVLQIKALSVNCVLQIKARSVKCVLQMQDTFNTERFNLYTEVSNAFIA